MSEKDDFDMNRLRYDLNHFLGIDCTDVADGFVILMHQMQLEYEAGNPAMKAMAKFVFELVFDGVQDTQSEIKRLKKIIKDNQEFAGALDEDWDKRINNNFMNQQSTFDD